MHRPQKMLFAGVFCIILSLVIAGQQFMMQTVAFAHDAAKARITQAQSAPPALTDIQLDSRLPMQTMGEDSGFTNINAKFGSRFDFAISPGVSRVSSGTDGIFHDNEASYIVGITPRDEHKTSIFHMGRLNGTQGDTYVANEHWIQGIDTTRWVGDTTDGEGMHIIVDFIDTFAGEPGCTAIPDCAQAVRDDTVPVFIVGVSLQNRSTRTRAGAFLFGSNRSHPTDACEPYTTQGGMPVRILSYDPTADPTGGTLFLAGDQNHWSCNTQVNDRAGLSWNYRLDPAETSTTYLILGGWNTNQHLFVNPTLAPGCENEGLYAAQEWGSVHDVVDFAIDNLSTRDDLLGRAQVMENYLINNDVLTPDQRWLIGDTLRSYKASSWLMGRQACAGGGYDAAVYEGSYGFLSTIDVMHEYSYFEITRAPWFFKAAMSSVFNNTTSDNFGTYFQHDQGADVDGAGNCTSPGKGTPTFRASCYTPPYVASGVSMPTEENDNVALLVAYYESITGDITFLQQHIGQINAAMQHNLNVGDPSSGIAYNSQDTNTTYDAASDCLHNVGADGAGNLYYQGLKEAAGYRATAYLNGLAMGGQAFDAANTSQWRRAAAKIESAMVREYNQNGFIPIANSSAFDNCSGRTITLGEGLFYLHLIGLDSSMNQTLLRDLAQQYPADLSASTLTTPPMIVMTSTSATGPQCDTGHCHRYSWFSKVMLSGVVADMIYTRHGCASCARLDMLEAAYNYNIGFHGNFGDGFHDDMSDWAGHIYPRGIISWALLDLRY